MGKLLAFALLCIFFTVSLVNADQTHPKSHVFLFGVAQYQTAEPNTDTLKSVEFGNLDFTVKDMEGLNDALVKARFCQSEDIQLLKNPNARDVEKAMRNMLSTVRKGDRVLVAFSGHGISLPIEDKMVDFLCAADSKITYNIETEKLAVEGLIKRSTLEEWLDASGAEIKLVFIDACRNVLEVDGGTDNIAESGNDVVRGLKGLGGIRGANVFGMGKASEIETQGFFRSSSCAPGEFSWEFYDKQHGIFTHSLIEGMLGKADEGGRGIITLADLQKYAIDETKKFVRENNKNPTQSPVVARLSETGVTEAHVLFSFAPNNGGDHYFWKNLNKQAALETLDNEIGNLIGYADHSLMKSIVAQRGILEVSFSQQAYQHTILQVANFRMQIERERAIQEWIRLNPPPGNRDKLRTAGQIIGRLAPGGGYIQLGTQASARSLEQRDNAMYERRKAIMLEELAVYSAEMGSSEGFVESLEERRSANKAALDELERRLKSYQGRQGYQNLANETSRLRNDNSRGVDVTARLADLEQRIENFIAEQRERPVEEQQRSTPQPSPRRR